MTKQEEIREGLKDILSFMQNAHGEAHEYRDSVVDQIFQFLHSQGVVLKVERELPSEYTDMGNLKYGGMMRADMLKAGYCAVEPLIE